MTMWIQESYFSISFSCLATLILAPQNRHDRGLHCGSASYLCLQILLLFHEMLFVSIETGPLVWVIIFSHLFSFPLLLVLHRIFSGKYATLSEVMAANNSISLQWRHNQCDVVSNHRRLDCLLNRFFRRRSKKNIKVPRHWSLRGESTADRACEWNEMYQWEILSPFNRIMSSNISKNEGVISMRGDPNTETIGSTSIRNRFYTKATGRKCIFVPSNIFNT